jgi:aspartyl-tRNA synthetase
LLRTHTCGELKPVNEGERVTLCGFVWKSRDLGGLLFVDLRDRYGFTQIVFDPGLNGVLADDAASLHGEDVIKVTGVVRLRPADMRRDDVPTGEIEVRADDIRVLSRAARLPFLVAEEETAKEPLRLKYRYLDLRRPPMQRNLEIRHVTINAIRQYLNSCGFLEVETPILMKSTPEGARDYLVPSRVHKGNFYALPQSPQMYKQLLMVAGLDRYYQIARCFRDEDPRADRQPEFTQLDLEMSFAEEDDVFEVTEGTFAAVFREALGEELTLPFPRMTYHDAMNRYGRDKPDVRFDLEIADITEVCGESESAVFKKTVDEGGRVYALVAPGGLSRKQADELEELAKDEGAAGLASFKVEEGGKLVGALAKFFPPALSERLLGDTGAKRGDTVLAAAGRYPKTADVMGSIRLTLAEILGVSKAAGWHFLWVTDFPLFEEDLETGEPVPSHHPFTAPKAGDIEFLETEPLRVMSRAYDIVLNGVELGSGSVRIFEPELQRRVLRAVGVTDEEIKERFGFFLEALSYGVPPHAGIAPGIDRLVSLICGVEGIRDVIAFPKTTEATSPMDGSPSPVSPRQLRDLGLSLDVGKGSGTD